MLDFAHVALALPDTLHKCLEALTVMWQATLLVCIRIKLRPMLAGLWKQAFTSCFRFCR